MKAGSLLSQVAIWTLAYLGSSCGGAGKSGGGGGSGASYSTVTGTIQSSAGSTAEFEGWNILLVEKETGEARTGSILATGGYTLAQVDTTAEYSLVLLTAEYKISSVLSMISADQQGKVFQWFTLESTTIPRLIHKGPSMEFSDASLVDLSSDVADDSDSDGIPDGMETSSSLASTTISTSTTETNDGVLGEDILGMAALLADEDGDGIDNTIDADIDGDGLANWFDDDDDGNGTLDIFDLDANSDVTLDSSQQIGDHYFGEEVEHIAVQVFNLADSVTHIKMLIKLASGINPTSVSIISSEDLFDESQVVTRGEDGGEEASDIWDLELEDDGDNYDDSASDNTYARKVKLKSGKSPDENQVLLFALNFGSYIRVFPFTFPDVTVSTIDFSFSSSSSTVTKSGTPFGSDETGYVWSVTAYDDEGSLVHSSALIDASTDEYTIPESDLSDSSITYTGKVTAQSLEKVSGSPVYVIESDEENLD